FIRGSFGDGIDGTGHAAAGHHAVEQGRGAFEDFHTFSKVAQATVAVRGQTVQAIDPQILKTGGAETTDMNRGVVAQVVVAACGGDRRVRVRNYFQQIAGG